VLTSGWAVASAKTRDVTIQTIIVATMLRNNESQYRRTRSWTATDVATPVAMSSAKARMDA